MLAWTCVVRQQDVETALRKTLCWNRQSNRSSARSCRFPRTCTAVLVSPLILLSRALGINNKELIDAERPHVPSASPGSCAIYIKLTGWH